mmetsp:Transcript_45579/g.51421  ORF Transcript_45579/g.51421 Transcript_45579/m.51421 type:complete len:142 (+) Transcript_45579:80-505(+)
MSVTQNKVAATARFASTTGTLFSLFILLLTIFCRGVIVHADICKSNDSVPCNNNVLENPSGNDIKSYGINGIYYCIDDGCDVKLVSGKQNATQEICGVTLSGIKDCVPINIESAAAAYLSSSVVPAVLMYATVPMVLATIV